jgi:hypothetical protein
MPFCGAVSGVVCFGPAVRVAGLCVQVQGNVVVEAVKHFDPRTKGLKGIRHGSPLVRDRDTTLIWG